MPVQIKEDLHEIATLAWSLTGAHSCAIFVPTEILTPSSHGRMRDSFSRSSGAENTASSIDMVALRSHSRVVQSCRIPVGSGLLGWVADQGRPIHLSPFEVGSAALGIYLESEPVKSLVAVPIVLAAREPSSTQGAHGVLMCDSLCSDSFSNSRVKALEQLASITRRLLGWAHIAAHTSHVETSWEIFSQKTMQLGDAIGASSIELLKLRMDSFDELRQQGGISSAVQLTEQFFRLAQQTLPPHFPMVKLPSGDVLISIDNMMSSFFQQKLHSLATHLHKPNRPITVRIEGYTAVLDLRNTCDLDATLKQAPLSTTQSSATVTAASKATGGTRA